MLRVRWIWIAAVMSCARSPDALLQEVEPVDEADAGIAHAMEPYWGPAGIDPPTCAAHSATLGKDGTVIVIGACTLAGEAARTVRFDPSGSSWSILPEPSVMRSRGSTALLEDGRILVAGGVDPNGDLLSSTELFDPAT